MSISNDERFVIDLLKREYGVDLRKIPESNSASPDFEFCPEDKREFVAELKSVEQSPPPKGWVVVTHSDGTSGAIPDNRNDSRVGTIIHKAWRQLKKYDEPKALVFLNHDSFCDIGHLEAAYSGCGLFTDGQHNAVDVSSLRVAAGRIAEEKTKIDLYIWIDEQRGNKVYIRTTGDEGERLADAHFPEQDP